MSATIYCLIDPVTDQVRYVGCTKTSLANRLSGHCGTSQSSNPQKRLWVRSLRNLGLKPVIKQIEVIELSNSADRENFWINHFREQGADLLNIRKSTESKPMTKEQIEEARRLLGIGNSPEKTAYAIGMTLGSFMYNLGEAGYRVRSISHWELVEIVPVVLSPETETAGVQ